MRIDGLGITLCLKNSDGLEIIKQQKIFSRTCMVIASDSNMHYTANIHYMARAWLENGKIILEIQYRKVFVPELFLELKTHNRPIEDWYEDIFTDYVVSHPEVLIPPVEICEEPVLIEVIGEMGAWTEMRFGFYEDEDMAVEILQWSIEFDVDASKDGYGNIAD